MRPADIDHVQTLPLFRGMDPMRFDELVAGAMLQRFPALWRMLDRQGPPPEGLMPRSGHAVIVGYGRVGEMTGHALGGLTISFGVIEADIGLARRLNSARRAFAARRAAHDAVRAFGRPAARRRCWSNWREAENFGLCLRIVLARFQQEGRI